MIRPTHSPAAVARLAVELLDMKRDDLDDLLLVYQALSGKPDELHALTDRLSALIDADADGWLDATRWPMEAAQNRTPTTDDLPDLYGPD